MSFPGGNEKGSASCDKRRASKSTSFEDPIHGHSPQPQQHELPPARTAHPGFATAQSPHHSSGRGQHRPTSRFFPAGPHAPSQPDPFQLGSGRSTTYEPPPPDPRRSGSQSQAGNAPTSFPQQPFMDLYTPPANVQTSHGSQHPMGDSPGIPSTSALPSSETMEPQAFERGREIGFLQAELQRIREDRNRLRVELSQSKAEQEQLRQDLETIRKELVQSREETASVRGQLRMLSKQQNIPETPQMTEARLRKMSLSSAKSGGSVSKGTPVYTHMNTELDRLFQSVEQWAQKYLFRSVDNIEYVRVLREEGARVVKSRMIIDVVRDPVLRRFLAAAIINDHFIVLLGGGLLEQVDVLSKNQHLLELKNTRSADPTPQKQKELLERRAALVGTITSEPGWVTDAEMKTGELADKIMKTFYPLIFHPAMNSASADLRYLVRQALSVAQKMVLAPRDWAISVGQRGERWDPHSMTQVDQSIDDGKLTANPYAYMVRFGVRPSITEKEYSSNGQKVKEVSAKTVMLMRAPTPRSEPQPGPSR